MRLIGYIIFGLFVEMAASYIIFETITFYVNYYAACSALYGTLFLYADALSKRAMDKTSSKLLTTMSLFAAGMCAINMLLIYPVFHPYIHPWVWGEYSILVGMNYADLYRLFEYLVIGFITCKHFKLIKSPA